MEIDKNRRLKEEVKIYLIMGSTDCLRDPLEVLEAAIDGGITMFQFREKGPNALSGPEKKELAIRLRDVCRARNIPFIVNDDVALALEIKADGVHIGQEDEDAALVRKKIGKRYLGVSVHSVAEAEAATGNGADYLGIGPVFPTMTKADAQPARGDGLIRNLRESGFSVPIVGIGGITPDNAASVIRAGADGVSFISALTRSDDCAGIASKFAAAVRNAGSSQ